MGKPTGFIEFQRRQASKRAISERLADYAEIELPMSEPEIREQAARCMDCGIPFCHATGCPLANLIPEWNDMVYRGHWRPALELLHATNNLPEITGRLCPAPCEPACTLALNQEAVTIRQIELELVEYGWRQGWIKPQPPATASGFRVAIIGSGPAGLAAAQPLARAGHQTVVFEKNDRLGGILRYGIPDFKLDKGIIDRRLRQMTGEGVCFEPSVEVGRDISIRYLLRSFDAVLLAGGAMVPRDLPVPGRDLQGIHFAMEFLVQQNRRNAGDQIRTEDRIEARDRHVVVVGGGDTGADCVGTALRQGAKSVRQLEIMERPPTHASAATPWPMWPLQLRNSSSHEEGGERQWSVMTKQFLGDSRGRVRSLRLVDVDWQSPDPSEPARPVERKDTAREIPADLVLLAMGFTREGNTGILDKFGIASDQDHRPIVDHHGMTNVNGVFLAGDLATGASLVVRAIAEGRRAAELINQWLPENQV